MMKNGRTPSTVSSNNSRAYSNSTSLQRLCSSQSPPLASIPSSNRLTTNASLRSSASHKSINQSSYSRNQSVTRPLSLLLSHRQSFSSKVHTRDSSQKSMEDNDNYYNTSRLTDAQYKAAFNSPNYEVATLGIGCYWGTEHFYRKFFSKRFPDSILDVKVGFMGGDINDPSYTEVCTGSTGHIEVAQIIFNPKKADYSDIIKFMFTIHDPTTPDRQINDEGPQYASVVFTHSDRQKEIASTITSFINEKLSPTSGLAPINFTGPRRVYEELSVTTRIKDAETFYSAHDAHQFYLFKNPQGYCNHSIRFEWDDRLEEEFINVTGGTGPKTTDVTEANGTDLKNDHTNM